MISFTPNHLNAVRDEVFVRFPDAVIYADKEDTFAQDILADIRKNRLSFAALSGVEMRYSYQLSQLCGDEEFAALQTVFVLRMNPDLFEIGWRYCQNYPGHHKAVKLFTEACKWLEKNWPPEYQAALVSKTGYFWDAIFERSAEILRVEKLSAADFCDKYRVGTDTPFFQRVQLAYFSRCEKPELLENEALLVRLIHYGELEYLRPAVKNYISKFGFDSIPERISDALTYRLSAENGDETLGLAPSILKHLRNIRFCSVLGECVDIDSQKKNVYNSVAGMARNIELLTHGFFAINFGKYVVLDNGDWNDTAYAYTPQVFGRLLEDWRSAEYPENYWPGAQEPEIVEAREIVLGLRQADIVRLGFSGFELLYTRDLLSIARY